MLDDSIAPATMVADTAPPRQSLDMQQLIDATQRISRAARDLTIVWWMPSQLWRLVLAGAPRLTALERAQALAALDEYILFAVFRAKHAASGELAALRPELLQANSRLQIDGVLVPPLAERLMRADALRFLAEMRPGLVRQMGTLGAGVAFMSYSRNYEGRELVAPQRTGEMSFDLFEQTFRWHLPLHVSAVAAPGRTAAGFPIGYRFNPYTGEELI